MVIWGVYVVFWWNVRWDSDRELFINIFKIIINVLICKSYLKKVKVRWNVELILIFIISFVS